VYVLETEDTALGVRCNCCDGDSAVSASLTSPDLGVTYEVLHCLDCGYVRLVRAPWSRGRRRSPPCTSHVWRRPRSHPCCRPAAPGHARPEGAGRRPRVPLVPRLRPCRLDP
jgi:hypothetical protein